MRRTAVFIAVSIVNSALPAPALAQVARRASSVGSVPSLPSIGPSFNAAPSALPSPALSLPAPSVSFQNPSPFSPAPAPVASAAPAALTITAPAAAKPLPFQNAVPAALAPSPFSARPDPASDAPEARALPHGSQIFDGARLPASSVSGDRPEDPAPVRIPNRHPAGRRFTSGLARWTGAAAVYSLYRDGVLVQRYAARLVDGNSPPARRAAAARLLASFGRVETVPTLGWAHENDPSPRVRRAALAALLHVAREAGPKLIRTLKTSPRPGSRQAAATTLSWLVSRTDAPEAVEALGAAATMDPVEDVRLAAVSALSIAINPKAQAALQWALASEVRPHMRSSLELALAESRRRHSGLGLHRAPSSEDLAQTQSPLREIALKRALAVSAVFVAVEFAGAWLTGSVALKADAMHLAADQMVGAAALIALWVSRRPPNSRKSYGYLKVEPVVALMGAAMIVMMGFEMGTEAWHRLFNPGEAATWSVALFALSSLAANLISAALLWRFKDDGLSMKSAFLHAATDAIGSVGVILSAAAAILLGWLWVEPVAVAFILVMLARVAWELGKPAWNTLIDAVPEGLDLDKIEADLLAIPGAAGVRDLHVWALNSRMNSLTAIVYIREGANHEQVLAAAKAVLREKHGIGHVTVQVETIKAEP